MSFYRPRRHGMGKIIESQLRGGTLLPQNIHLKAGESLSKQSRDLAFRINRKEPHTLIWVHLGIARCPQADHNRKVGSETQ